MFPVNAIRTVHDEGSYVAEINVDIPLKHPEGLARCNVYRPAATADGERFPVLMTMGPYGKDIPYADFHPGSWKDVPDEQKSKYSAWETPDPKYWTTNGYVVVRVDERGLGQSPGSIIRVNTDRCTVDTMSATTASDFAQCIEWASEQSWSDGKIGLLGISYYAGSQWRVAARRPKGLTCIIPWEGMTDYLRDRCRQGGIYSNGFIKFWWNRQVVTNQYGLAGRAARKWGPDTIEGDQSEDQLKANRRDQVVDNAEHCYSDDPYYTSREYNLTDIEVPMLSVANLGGITLHLRGNVVGYLEAGSKNKWLFFVSGRHDIPFYWPENVALQKSFLDAWMKGKDDRGWLEGPNVKVPAIRLLVRKGNPGWNSIEAERSFGFREEHEWPLDRTNYVRYNLHSDGSLSAEPQANQATLVTEGLTGRSFKFETSPFQQETEITGHILANLTMGVAGRDGKPAPKDLDVMVTLRHIDPDGKEVFYTGSSGDNVPVCKGHLRASLRKINDDSPRHKDFLPYRRYASADRQWLEEDTPYDLLVELWPTSLVVSPGGKLVLEVSPKDEQGSGKFTHDHPLDRNDETHGGKNIIYFGQGHQNWLQLPIIPTVGGQANGTVKGAGAAGLKIIIVGAGIAGLTAALALRQPGHDITILEQTRMKSEIGAAIHVAPNASKILRKLGVDMTKNRASICKGLHEYGTDSALHMKVRVEPEQMAGAPWTLNHRVDLHTALKKAVLDPHGKGSPPVIRGEAKVESVECEEGVVILSTGETLKADLIIGADGIHSAVRKAVIGESVIARPSGLSAYRCLFTRESIEDIPEAAEILDAEDSFLKIVIGDKQERTIMYPCRDNTTLNVVAVCSDKVMNEESSQSWQQAGDVEDMVRTFQEFPAWVQTLLSRAESPGLWQLRDQEPLKDWVKGRCIIIGDAAHAMLPHQGQGGAQAIEDGEALGAFFEAVVSPASLEVVNTVLKDVFAVRYERASIVQSFSRTQAMPPSESKGGHVTNSKQFMPWNWNYDGAKDWQKRQKEGRASLNLGQSDQH